MHEFINSETIEFSWFNLKTPKNYCEDVDFYNQMTDSRKAEKRAKKVKELEKNIENFQGELANCQRDLQTRGRHFENCQKDLDKCQE